MVDPIWKMRKRLVLDLLDMIVYHVYSLNQHIPIRDG